MSVMLLVLSLFFSADAERLFEESRWSEARGAWEAELAGVEEPSGRAVILDWIGRTWLMEGDAWRAEECFTRSLAAAETGLAHIHRGQAYFVAGQRNATDGGILGAEVQSLMNDAVREIERGLEMEPESAEAWTYLGLCEFYRRETIKEATAYRRALAVDPARLDATLYLVQLLERQGDLVEARKVLAQVAKERRDFGLHLAAGRLAALEEDWETAREGYLGSILAMPDETAGYQGLWDVTALRRRFTEFAGAMHVVLRSRTEAWLPHYYLGYCHKMAGNTRQAIESFRVAWNGRRDETWCGVMIGEIYREVLKDEAAAIAIFLEVLEVEPSNLRSREVLASLGLRMAREGQPEKAGKIFLILKEANPTDWSHTLNLALVEKELGRLERAIELYEEAEERFVFEPQIPNDRGLLLMGMGREQEAMAAFRTALLRDDEFLDALENLGAYTVLLGRPKEALVFFRRALDRLLREGGDASKFRRYLDESARMSEEQR